ncbi:MAG: threonylcarbamoyl-AMP synthase [Cyclobacteriaceae bacterium]|nr:threonylcarbamoyl-AMP synthase [Cyclobacteriaceae bacterium]
MAIIGKDIQYAATLLKEGSLVAIPTETVYGLAANALDAEAVTKIFSAKQRPHFDPLIVHVSSFEKVSDYVSEIYPHAIKLAKEFWPGPLTILLPKKSIIPDLVTSGLDRVGVRCPDHPLTLSLLQQLTFPVAAPSANPFGYVSPTSAQHVQDQLGEKIPYILDGGNCKVGIESTIIGWENDQPVLYRLGGISQEAIEKITGPVKRIMHSTSQPQAPGQLTSHYAPGKKFLLGNIESLMKENAGKKAGVLSFGKGNIQNDYHLNLSENGNLEEAARNLFSMLRKFDSMNVDLVIAEEVPEEGLGKAINDRLRRAAATPQ